MKAVIFIPLLIAMAGWVAFVWLIARLANNDRLLMRIFSFIDRLRVLLLLFAGSIIVAFLLFQFAPQIKSALRWTANTVMEFVTHPTASATGDKRFNTFAIAVAVGAIRAKELNPNHSPEPPASTTPVADEGRRKETPMLFGSTLLEVAIGMIFVYLLLSLLCSALSELMESFIKFRARDLEKGILKLLNDPDLANEFFNHPLVKPLGDNPSYIPARTFSLALWNIATTRTAQAEAAAPGVTQDLSAIRTMIAGIQDAKLQNIKKALLTLIDEAGTDINKARANIEQWYNDAMDRVSGWYKRRTHWILIVLGLLAAIAFNVDSITVVKALWYNDGLRASVVAAAEDYAKAHPTPVPGATPMTPEQQAAEARQKISTITGQFNSLNLPVGWPIKPDANNPNVDTKAYDTDPRWPAPGFGGFILKVLGLIITALAVSQGAPFWFDMLNKFIVIRSTVKPSEKSQPEGSKDKSPSPPQQPQPPQPPQPPSGGAT